MSTKIDQIEVEITSNSTGAAAGIDALAASLGKLKQNGTISVAVKNLNNLTTALKNMTSVTSNANKISSLADAMAKLKSVGSAGTGVKKMAESLQSLKNVDYTSLSRVAESSALFERIGNSLGKLSVVNAGGFSSVVNSLARIGKVTDSLDDDTITRFTDRVKKLSDALTPLSSKMTTIRAGLRGVNSSAKSAGTGMKTLGTKVNATTLNLASLITVIQGVKAALMPVVRLLSNAIGDAMEWDGISYQFGNAFGEQADEYYEKITKITDALDINRQTFMETSAMATSMLKGFGVGSKDAREMGLGYTELAYDIWAAYNNVYKSLDGADGAMAAVRSAIAGEVEPIRRAGFTIVESQLEMTAANYGLAYSSEKATEAQKSYLRYLTLVDQAHTKGIVGAYASELNTAEGLTRTLTQQVKSLSQSFGSLFLPILVKIMPWLQAFVDLLTEAVVWVAGFFGIDIQPAKWNDATSSLGNIAGSADNATGSLGDAADAVDKTTNALKELKNASIGIDELNVISPPSNSSGSGSGAGGSGSGVGGGLGAFEGLDVDSLWDEAIFDQIKSKVDDIKEKLKGFFDEFGTQIKVIGALLATLGVAKLLEHLGQALGLGDKFLGVMGTIAKLAVTGIVIVLQYTLMTEFFDKYIDGEGFKEYVKALFVGAIGTGILYSMWGPAGLVIGLSVIAAASLKAVIDNGGITNTESAVVALTGFASAVGAVSIAWKLMSPVIDGMKEYASAAKLMAPEVGTLAAWFPKLSGTIASVSGAFSSAAQAVAGFIGGLSASVLAAIAAAIVSVASAAYFLYENWEEVKNAVKSFFQENIVPKLDAIKESWEKIKGVLAPLSPLFEKIGELIRPLIQWFKDAAESVIEFFRSFDWIEAIKTAFEKFGGVVFNSLTVTIAGTFQSTMGIIEGFVQVITGLVEIVGGVVEAIVKLFQGDLSGAWEACKKIGQGIADVFIGLYDMTIGAVVDFVEGCVGWFRKMWDILVGHSIVPDTVNAIVDWFKSLPSRLGNAVKNFVTGIIDAFKDLGSNLTKKFSTAWSAVKNWWANKESLSVPAIGVSLVKKGWTTIKGWIGSIPGVSQAVGLIKSGWSSVKKWIGSIPRVSQAVGLVKSGWSRVSSWIGSMPTLKAKIGLIKSGWTSIKSWLGNLSYKLKFTLPKIKVNWSKTTVAGFSISYPSGFSTYAKGGFPDMGEMFIAREAGPELVGKIGNRTTVANNEQIVEGISEGVYAAVLAAMRASENNGSQSVNVYLDGRQITSAVEKRQRERGATLMGSQVYAY